ncbi:hypothetical protein BU25DRAFT_495798 [Macroventuria anomochaeta]|uniref:Uncharacterized protein n=1 Tax=Macroventuria anomochaeta TaxID=301207 RepID=A0ACB6RHP4_9PLEO|nr:uncharacterized protein BU25DRAFT_495798 [Macroventuria anomochaeta]KAF2621363.1 hypothetical protein BU25DRAFT_495798 [Macroventuria anomochaeta]
MNFNNIEVFATVPSWLSGFLLGLWRFTPYITDRVAGLIVAFFVMVAMFIIHKHLHKNAIVGYLNRHVGEVQKMMPLGLQESHRKRIATLEANHNQAMREAQDEIRRLHGKFDHIDSEYDWTTTMYQGQMRCNEE